MAGPGDGVPGGVHAPVQYGPGVRAVATYLVAAHHLPLDRAAAVMSDLLAAPVSPGSINVWVAAAGERLAPFTDRVVDLLADAAVAHFDETGLRVDGRLAWVHAAATDRLTLYTCHERRGREAMDAAGVLPAFTGIAVHDCWAPYFCYPMTHAICNAHVVRNSSACGRTPARRGRPSSPPHWNGSTSPSSRPSSPGHPPSTPRCWPAGTPATTRRSPLGAPPTPNRRAAGAASGRSR